MFPDSLATAAGELRRLTDGEPSAYRKRALLRFIADGHLDRHLRRTRKIYGDRHRIVTGAVERWAGAGLVEPPAPSCAGLHVAMRLGRGRREAEIVERARAAGVTLGSFGDCWLAPDHPEGVIIGFGAVASDELDEALAVLDQILATRARGRSTNAATGQRVRR